MIYLVEYETKRLLRMMGTGTFAITEIPVSHLVDILFNRNVQVLSKSAHIKTILRKAYKDVPKKVQSNIRLKPGDILYIVSYTTDPYGEITLGHVNIKKLVKNLQ